MDQKSQNYSSYIRDMSVR